LNSVPNDKEMAIFNTVLTKKVVTHATNVEKYRDNNLRSVTTTVQIEGDNWSVTTTIQLAGDNGLQFMTTRQLSGDKSLQCYHHRATIMF